jgi:hypothetical protein
MSEYKPVLLTLEQLLDKRITEWSNSVPRTSRGSNYETEFSTYIEPRLPEMLTHLGYTVEAVSREFSFAMGRADFLVKTSDGYIIIEVKTSQGKNNKDLYFSYGIGQLLTYKAIMTSQYNIDPNTIKCIIITNDDSLLLTSTIGFHGLDITHLVVVEEGVKCYG